jgi:Flp pilus assembly pilin Flp
MRWIRRDDGAATVEYAGVAFVVVMLVLTFVTLVTPVGYVIMAKICEAMGGSCSSLGPDARARDLKVPCVLRQTDRTLGYNVNVEFVRGDRKDTDQIRTSADGSATVTLTQGGGLGLEAAKQTGGKGAEGKARITANGDLGYVYNFPTDYGGRGAAEDFLGDRRSGVNQGIDIVVPGAQTVREGVNQAGNAVSDGWDWATDKVGLGPSAEEKAAKERAQAAGSPDAVQVSLSLQGAAGVSLDGGIVKGSGELSGQVKGTAVVALHQGGPDTSSSSFTGSAQFDIKGDVTLGVPGDPRDGTQDLPPILNLNGAYGQTVSYMVVFDENGDPTRLVLSHETRTKGGIGLNPPKVGVGSGGTTAGGKATADTGSLTLETTTLDLKDAANRAAFDEFFITYGVDAGDVHAKVADIPLDGGIAGIAQRWDALQQRLDADGFEASYQYETSGDALSANGGEKAAKAGGWGVGGEKTSSGRELVSAVARDNRYGGTEVPLATCGK